MLVKRNKFVVLGYYYSFVASVISIAGLALPIRWSVVETGLIEPLHREIIKPDVPGVIAEVFVKSGDVVKKGQSIARISDPAIATMLIFDKAEYERARMQIAYARKMRKEGYLSARELRDAEITYEIRREKIKQAKNYEILSPVAGTILTTDEINLRVGDKVEEGSIIVTVADMSRMRMKIRIHEHNVSKVKVGDKVRIYMNAYPPMLYSTLSGHISQILPQADSDLTGIYFVAIVDIDLESLSHGRRRLNLIPGMAGTAKILYERSSFFEHVVSRGLNGI